MKIDKVYWGDLHSHCNISYGDGSLKNAINRASKQLDFCTITGHAFWPDIDGINHLKSIKNYHIKGFKKLKSNWNKILNNLKKLEKKYSIIIFPSYEWHNLKFGDHNIINKNFNLKLLSSETLDGLKKKISQDSFVIPHHIGYGKNKRGINWDYFDEKFSPFVEIFSMHGLSIDEVNSYKMLHDMGLQTYILDGDNVRMGLNKDLGFSAEDRTENIRRITEVAKLFADSGSIILTAFISPYREDRDKAREIISNDDFIEIFVSADLSVCEDRDPKGLYKKARSGEIKGFTGIDAPYEAPLNPELIVETDKNSIEESAQIVVDYLIENGIISKKLI